MESLAIIGTGIAGMACAHYLHKKYNITLYEKNDYVGGHTNTVAIDEDRTQIYIDTGFMVFNHVTYPLLTQLFKDLNVPTKPTSMSFSVQHMPSGLEYSGSGLNGLFAQRRNIFSRKHLAMLKQIARFNTESVKILDDPTYQDHSIEEYIKKMKYGDDMFQKYLVPMSSAVWSTPKDKIQQFPAVTLIRFFKNHGFLGLNTQHQWYTVVNGSKTYRDIIIQPFKENIVLNNAATQIYRENGKTIVTTKNGAKKEFDKVILACHGDEALQLLAQPTSQEKQLLQPFKYQKNTATLHTDHSVMPKLKRVWSSWNYRIEQKTLHPTTTYWMNSLQHVSKNKNYFVSINDPGNIDEKKIIRHIDYTHPLFDVAAIKAQKELSLLNKNGPIYFCGSYFRYGFHEDALWSAHELCQKLNEFTPV